jgi:integral membrane protein (TIGR01906 family)
VSDLSAGESGAPKGRRLAGWLVTLAVPVFLVLGTIRILMTPLYAEIEYRTPGFPDDTYGFTLEERLYWSRISIAYLVNNEGINYLADLRFPEGQQIPEPACSYVDDCSRFYNDRELQHMVDVKNVVQRAMWVLWISIGLLFVTGVVAWRGGWLGDFRASVARGGWLTVILAGSIILFVILAFGVIFVWFHQVFFEPGTWSFFYSDSLIRLFPERFWRDTFLVVAGFPALIGAALGYFLGRITKQAA